MLDRLALALRMLPALPKLVGARPGSTRTVADRFEQRARRDPEAPYLLFEADRFTYAEANARANRVAHWARDQGLGRGDVVALFMENRPEYLFTWGGLCKLGVVTALINTNLQGRGLRHALEAAGVRHVVLGAECAERFATADGDYAAGLTVWRADDPWAGSGAAATPGARSLDEALGTMPEHDPDPGVREGLTAGDDLFYIYTSGTTGLPKAARFSHLRFLGIGELVAFALGLRPSDVFYCALPLYHTAGGAMLVSGAQAAGATVALRRRFSASRFWDDVREFDATCFQYIGEFCRYLLHQPPGPGDSDHRVRAAVGNGLRPDIWREFQERFAIPHIVEFYGSTEGNTAIINLENKEGSVGRFPFRAASNARLVRFDVEAGEPIRDERGFCIECAPGEPGELLGKITNTGPRFEGYTSQEATERKILRDVFRQGDAWFRSGDLLRQDDDGFFYFVDRIGDTFRWKGENVSTQEVAEALTTFRGVEIANVYGVAVPGHDGRAGMAAVALAPGARFDGAAFYAHVERALPRYAAPLFVRLQGEVELTGTFKLRKVDLQREGFGPEVSDPLWVRDDDAGAYVPLDDEARRRLADGKLRV